MRNDPEVQRVVDTYQLGLPRTPVAGRSGELLGRGTGSSLEFQEFREYIPGDDIRHVDWSAYARSDTLMVRLYREEISPQTQILIDGSASMRTGGDAKPLVAKQLAAAFALLCGRLGGRAGVVACGDQTAARTGLEGLDVVERLAFDSRATLVDLLDGNQIPLQRQSVRIVISDFLFPHDPESLIRRLAAGASALWVLQLLSAWEAAPTPSGGRRLVDVESAAETDLILDRRTIEGYQKRLQQLQAELARNCRRVHATFVPLIADKGLQTLCREDLCAAEVLRVA